MEGKEEKKKGRPKNLLLKTLKKCCSMRPPPLNGTTGVSDGGIARSPKSKSWPRRSPAPEGCFSVRVGPAKEKYVVRTECLNHPLFRELLDAAEMEYGYAVDGPLELPCDVGRFMRVMEEIENGEQEEWFDWAVDSRRPSCNFAYNSYQLLSPSRRPAMVCRRLFRSATVDRGNEI